MVNNSAEQNKQYSPLVDQVTAESGSSAASSHNKSKLFEKQLKNSNSFIGDKNTFCRAENEDDDGYDPYSDRIEITSFFEKDPWN